MLIGCGNFLVVMAFLGVAWLNGKAQTTAIRLTGKTLKTCYFEFELSTSRRVLGVSRMNHQVQALLDNGKITNFSGGSMFSSYDIATPEHPITFFASIPTNASKCRVSVQYHFRPVLNGLLIRSALDKNGKFQDPGKIMQGIGWLAHNLESRQQTEYGDAHSSWWIRTNGSWVEGEMDESEIRINQEED